MWQKPRVFLSKVVLLVALLGLYPTMIWAQSGATASAVSGVVTDEQGAVVGGATVTAKNVDTNFMREAASGEDGSFLITQLPPGNYEVIVGAEGFKTQSLRVALVLGTTTRLQFNLEVGQTGEVIEVQAKDISEEGKTESSTNIDEQRIDSLPINRRNFLDFSLTAARVTQDRLPAQGAAASSGLSFNGQTARFNNITIDGLDNNDAGPGTVRSTYSQEAVQEFQILSDSYSAEFGRSLAGVVNIVTKGGGNEYHGTLFGLVRNDAISARDVFAPTEPEYRQYQFGATLGGPIKKDKAFFFISGERLTIAQNQFVTISDQIVQSARRLGFLLNNGPVPFSVGNTAVLGRLDYRISNNDSLYVRYNYGASYNGAFEPFGALTGETTAGVQRLDDDTLAVSNTYINPGLNLVNETRFLYGFREQKVTPSEGGPQVRIFAPEGQVVFGRGAILPQQRAQRLFQFVNNTTLQRGRNTIKFGIDFLRGDTPGRRRTNLGVFPGGLSVFLPLNFAQIFGIPGLPAFSGPETFDPTLRNPAQRAFLTIVAAQLPGFFPGFPSGLPLADLPIPSTFVQGFGNSFLQVTTKSFSGYLQDDIKVKPNLLVKAGVRYDINRTDFIPENDGNFSPRVAISYQPTFLPRASVRAAYGIFFASPLLGGTFASGTTQSGAFKITTIPFPFSILAFSQPGRKFPDSETLPPGVQFIPQLSQTFPYEPNTRASYSHQATLGIDYFIGDNTAISVSYQLVRGLKLFSLRNINPVIRPVPGNPVASLITGRIDPTKGDVIELETAFDSYYHGFTVALNRRLSRRVGFLAHYTFSKSIDNFLDVRPDVLEANNSLDIGAERALSLQDVRSRLVISGTWDISYSKNPLLNGYQLSTIMNFNSGRTYNLLAGADLNQNGDFPPGDRPLGIARNAGITPGFANVDLRVSRTVNINERIRVQGFFEIFNLFNRVNISEVARLFQPDAQGNFNLPPRDDSGRFKATDAQFRNAFAPRQAQFGIRVNF